MASARRSAKGPETVHPNAPDSAQPRASARAFSEEGSRVKGLTPFGKPRGPRNLWVPKETGAARKEGGVADQGMQGRGSLPAGGRILNAGFGWVFHGSAATSKIASEVLGRHYPRKLDFMLTIKGPRLELSFSVEK